MNIFTTDHPMATEPFEWSWFNRKQHPWLSLLCSTLLLAFVFSPAVLYGLYCWFMSDNGGDITLTLKPWPGFIVGFATSLVLSLVPAFPLVLVYRAMERIWRKWYYIREHGFCG